MTQDNDVLSIVVMGVSGSGKTTIGLALSKNIGCTFLDADALHTPDNIKKMTSGHALDDEDRWPWLQSVGERIKAYEEDHLGSVTACSSLRRSYRDVLRNFVPDLFFVYLGGSLGLTAPRVETRANNVLPRALLGSQFDVLEPLEADEVGLCVDAEKNPNEIVNLVVRHLSATT